MRASQLQVEYQILFDAPKLFWATYKQLTDGTQEDTLLQQGWQSRFGWSGHDWTNKILNDLMLTVMWAGPVQTQKKQQMTFSKLLDLQNMHDLCLKSDFGKD